jgi:hypothetical protein
VRGCRTDRINNVVVEWHWKGQPERVIAPYIKLPLFWSVS